MSITYYANKVRETSTTTGVGNLVLGGSPLGYKTFISTIGSNKTLSYYIYRQDTNFEWEIGIGYILSSGGINQLVRQRVISSTNNNTFVGFTSGTKFIETIISENIVNNSFINYESKSASFSPPYAPATYVIDASSSNIVIDLPQVSTQSDPIVIGFILSATSGNVYKQNDAITIDPYASETINGSSSTSISIIKDYLQIISVPSQSGWLKMDPIQDSSDPYGYDGSIQVKYNGAFSGINEFVWDNTNKSLLIGNSGNATADIVLASPVSQTTIFNQRLYDKDFRIAGTGNSHLLFVDGGANTVSINTSSSNDTLTIDANNQRGIFISKSGVGPTITLSNSAVSGLATSNNVGSIVFSGLNSSNSYVQYGKISSVIESASSSNERSKIQLGILNNGSFDNVAVFSFSGISLGFNNSNINGTVIGSASYNNGNNIALGYYNSVLGSNCVAIGDNITISSGTFGGAIGQNHSVSGNNIWVFGGENINASGNNSIYLSVDNNNYLSIMDSGNFVLTTKTNKNNNFVIKNNAILSSGIDQNIVYSFVNNSGIEKTGLVLSSIINNINNNQESSSLVGKIIHSGSVITVIDIDGKNITLGSGTYSGNNIGIGNDQIINNTNLNYPNISIGEHIKGTGFANYILGSEINYSGSYNTLFGYRNNGFSAVSTGNINILGNNNTALYTDSSIIGSYSTTSGMITTSIGYSNGIYGDYSTCLGNNNVIGSRSSTVVGGQNYASGTAYPATLCVLGYGNYGNISNTGFIGGYTNQMRGSGGVIIGNNISSSGNNNVLIGGYIQATGSNNIVIASQPSGFSFNRNNSIALFYNNNNYITVSDSGVVIKTTGDFVFDRNIFVSGYANVRGDILSSGNCIITSGINVGTTGTFNNIIVKNNIVCTGNLSSSGNLNVNFKGTFNNVEATGALGITTQSFQANGNALFASWVKCNDGLILNNMSTPTGVLYTADVMPTGQDRIHKLLYQQDAANTYNASRVRYEPLAKSDSVSAVHVLSANDSEYQFLNPSSATVVHLPNGSGLYMGKKFDIFNIGTSNNITLKKYGSATIETILPGRHTSIVHAGNDQWVRIVSSGIN